MNFNLQIKKLGELLALKSQSINLFSKGDRELLEEKHLPDVMAFFETNWQFGDKLKVIDLGTGGGLPGLALAINRKLWQFLLVDARLKKIKAVSEVAGELKLNNVAFDSMRLEDLANDSNFRESFDLAVARAVAALPTLLEYAAGFVNVGGNLVAWKGDNYQEEVEQSKNAMKILGWNLADVYEYSLPTGEARFLLNFKKIKPTPAKFPRKPNLPRELPLI